MLNYKKDEREVKIMSENDNKNINNEENTNDNENNEPNTENTVKQFIHKIKKYVKRSTTK